MEDRSRSQNNHEILAHLDQIFPFLQVDVAKVQELENVFSKVKPSDAYWEFWCIPEQQLPNLITLPAKMISFLQQTHRIYDERTKCWKVNPLDILTTIALFMKGEWKDRLRFLFRWFNSSQTNLLEEEEHFLLIRGVTRCLRKLRLLGQLDVTEADAHQIALEARVVYDDENIPHMRPGLLLDDLVNWLMKSKFCKVLLDFYAILCRLVDMMKTLDSRSSALLSLMEQKIETKRVDLPMPMFPSKRFTECESDIVITNITSDSVSFIVSTSHLLAKEDPQYFPATLHALVERRVYIKDEFYQIELPIVDRKRVFDDIRSAPNIHCCNKYFVESNVRSLHRNFRNLVSAETPLSSPTLSATYFEYIRLRGSDSSQGIQRYELDGLSPDTELNITVYSKQLQWRKVELKTSGCCENIIPKCLEKQYHICILPSSVNRSTSLQKHLLPIVGNHSEVHSSTVLTGSLLSAADNFQQYLFPRLESCRVLSEQLNMRNTAAIAEHLRANLVADWKMSGFDGVASAFRTLLFPMTGMGDVPLLHASGQHQLLSFNGDGPFASSHYCRNPSKRVLKRGFWRRWLFQLASDVNPELARCVAETIERLYSRRIASQVSPLRGVVSPVPNVTLFLTAHPQSVYYDPVTHCSLSRIAQSIQERHIFDALSSTRSSENVEQKFSRRYIILIRDPSDILIDSPSSGDVSKLTGKVQSSENTELAKDTKPTKPAEAEDSINPAIFKRLFGKYELVHGEYTKSENNIARSQTADMHQEQLPSDDRSSVSKSIPNEDFPRVTAQSQFTSNLTDFLQIALEYQRSHMPSVTITDAGSFADAIIIVCCNWLGGKNIRIVYRPPPREQRLTADNFSAPGYVRQPPEVQNTSVEEVVVLKIVNLSACEAFTEPADAYFLNQSAMFNKHPLLQEHSGHHTNHSDSMNWNARLIDAWKSRLPPFCTLEFDDDTDTRSFHLHNQSTLPAAAPLMKTSKHHTHSHQEHNHAIDEHAKVLADYTIMLQPCWKEDEIDDDDKDNDAVSELWYGSMGWDAAFAMHNRDYFAGSSGAAAASATGLPASSQQRSETNRSSFSDEKDLRSGKDLKKRKGTSSLLTDAVALANVYQRWDIPSFLLSHGCNVLPRRASRYNHAYRRVPFAIMTLYRPVYPTVNIGIAVQHFHANSLHQHSLSVTLRATGLGRLQCGILSLPLNVQFEDAIHLLRIAPISMIQRVHSIQNRWIHHVGSVDSASRVSFHFKNLQSGTKYAAFLWYSRIRSVSITGHNVGNPALSVALSGATAATSVDSYIRAIRDVVLVTTLPSVLSQPLPKLSFMFAPFQAEDFGESFFLDYQSPRIRMMHHLLNQFRFSYPAVQTLSTAIEEPAICNEQLLYSQQFLSSQLLAPVWREFGQSRQSLEARMDGIHHSDRLHLSQRHISSNFVSNRPSTQTTGKQHFPVPGKSSGSGIFVQFYGPFCVLKMQDDTATCLLDATQFLSSPELNFVPTELNDSTGKKESLFGYPDEMIRVLIVITSRTFVHCFRVKTSDFAGRGLHYQHAENGFSSEHVTTICFVRELCKWQSLRGGRDVRILTAAHIPDMLCIYLQCNHIPHVSNKGEFSTNDDRSVTGEQRPHFTRPPNLEKLDPFVLIMYVFPTNLQPPSEHNVNDDAEEDEGTVISATTGGVSGTVVSTPAATTVMSERGMSPGNSSKAEGNNASINANGHSEKSATAPLSIDTLSLPLPTNDVPTGVLSTVSDHSPAFDYKSSPAPVIPGSLNRENVGTLIPPGDDFSPSKSVISKKTLRSVSILSTVSSVVNDSIAERTTKKNIGNSSVALQSSKVSLNDTSTVSGETVSTRPIEKKVDQSKHQKRAKLLPFWIFPAVGEQHMISEDISFVVDVFSEAKSAKHFKPSQYHGQPQLPQLHTVGGSSSMSVGSLSSAPGSLGDAGGATVLNAAQFESFCSFYPAQHAWYMSTMGDEPVNKNIVEGRHSRISKRIPYEPLPVFHMLDFVLPVLPDVSRSTANGKKLSSSRQRHRTYPLTIHGKQKDALFSGSGGSFTTYLHHNSRMFVYPPKVRFLSQSTPPVEAIDKSPAVSNPDEVSSPRCWMFAHQVATSLDTLRIVVGPLVGQVTKHSVRILFEFNLALSLPSVYLPSSSSASAEQEEGNPALEIITRSVRCRLRYTVPSKKSSSHERNRKPPQVSSLAQDSIDVWMGSFKAFQPVVFVFQDLLPNVRYEILLPDLFPDRVLGSIQTLPLQCSSVELMFTADNCLVNIPVVGDLLRELDNIDKETSLPNIHQLLDWNKYLYNFRSEAVMEYASYQQPAVYVPSTTKVITGVTQASEFEDPNDVSVPQPSMWHFLTEAVESAATGNGIKSVFHVAPLSPIAELECKLWQQFSTHLNARSEAVLNSIRTEGDGNGESLELLQQFQLEALEHLVRDSFRVVLSSPPIAAAFATCGHMLLHHPKYLLPVQNHHTNASAASNGSELHPSSAPIQDRDRIIRRMFDHQVQLYVHSLFEGNMEQQDINKGVAGRTTKDVFRDWRQSGVVVAMVDIISYRLKRRARKSNKQSLATSPVSKNDNNYGDASNEELVITQVDEDHINPDEERSENQSLFSRASRGGGDDNDDDDESVSTNNPRSGFSPGFLDRKQWQRLRIYAGDNTILHLVMVFPQPLLSLEALRDTSISAESDLCLSHPDDNDEMIPWGPTNEDLTKFFRFWFDWMDKVKKESDGNETKSIIIVSSSKVPYSTLIQDLRSGFKIYQLCIGEYDLHTLSSGLTEKDKVNLAAEKLGISSREIVMSGKIGSSYRYVHQFQGQDCYRTEPSGLLSVATGSSTKGKQSLPNEEALTSEAVEQSRPEEVTDNIVSKDKPTKKEKKSKKKKSKGKDAPLDDEGKADLNMNVNLISYKCQGTGNVGFAKMKLYLDHWSPIAMWSNTNLTDLYNKQHNIGEATLLMGPLIGAPAVKRLTVGRGKSTRKSKISRRSSVFRTKRASGGWNGPDEVDNAGLQEEKDIEQGGDNYDDEDFAESVRVIEESRKVSTKAGSTNAGCEHNLPLFVPMMLEVDRITAIRIDVRGTFTHHHLVLEHTVPCAERPFVMEIGPLHRHDRYRVRFTSGINVASLGLNNTYGHPKEFVINTQYHRDESNFVVINMSSPGDDVSPAAVHLTDLRRRSNIAFHGVHNLVLTHFEPEVTDTLRTLQQSPLLVEGIEEFKEIMDNVANKQLQREDATPLDRLGPIVPSLLRKELTKVLSTLRERYRENFCGPSLRDLLRLNMNLLLPKLRYALQHTHHVHHQGQDVSKNTPPYEILRTFCDAGNGKRQETLEASIERLLHLLDAFVAQEYFDHFRFVEVNVHRVLLPVTRTNTNGQGEEVAALYRLWQEDGVQIDRADVFAEYVARDLEIYHEHQDALRAGVEASAGNSSQRAQQYKLLWMHESIGHAAVPLTKDSSTAATAHATREVVVDVGGNADGNDDGDDGEAVAARTPHTSATSPPPPDILEALIVAWIAGCIPAPTVFVPYHSLNRKASIERLRGLSTPDDVSLATRHFVRDSSVFKYPTLPPDQQSPDDVGLGITDELLSPQHATPSVRLLVLVDDDVHGTNSSIAQLNPSQAPPTASAPASPASPSSRQTEMVSSAFFRTVRDWQQRYATHREYHVMIPCVGHGTTRLALPLPVLSPTNPKEQRTESISVVLLDSIFRSNEYDRRHQIAELEKKMFKKQLTAAAAKSKRAQQKKDEEQKVLRAQIRQQVLNIVAEQKPDGYIFVHCHTAVMYSPIEKDPAAAAPNAAAAATAGGAPTSSSSSSLSASAAVTTVATAAVEGPSTGDHAPPVPADAELAPTKTQSSRPAPSSGMMIIDTVGGTPSTAAPVSAAIVNRTEAAPEETLMLMDAHQQVIPVHDAAPSRQPVPQQRDDLTIVSIDVCGDMLPIQLDYEARLDREQAAAAKLTAEEMADENVPKPPPPLSAAEYLQQLQMRRRYDYVQYPPWFVAFFPAHVSSATFVVDEVLLLLRQLAKTQTLLATIENDPDLYQKFVHRYERSRLSELSRPEDLREVDMSSPDVIAVFFYDVLRTIWQEDLTAEMKGVMLSWQDPFVIGYIASRAFQLPSETVVNSTANNSSIVTGGTKTPSIIETLHSPALFAQGMRRVCAYAMAMKMARDMSVMRRYQHILTDVTDPAIDTVKELEITERMIDNVRRKRHAERRADKQLKALMQKLTTSMAKKDGLKPRGTTMGANNKGKMATRAGTKPAAAAAAAAPPATGSTDVIDVKNMDLAAMAEKMREEDAHDEVLAAEIAEIQQLRAEDVDYESDIEELIKEAERHEQQLEEGENEGDEASEGGQIKRTAAVMPSKAQRAAQADVNAMLAAEERNRKPTKQGDLDDSESNDVMQLDDSGHLDASAIQALKLQRGQWEQDTMQEGVDQILDSLIEESVETFQGIYIRELVLENMIPVTSEERTAWAALRMKRLADERQKYRRIYGQRANPLGI